MDGKNSRHTSGLVSRRLLTVAIVVSLSTYYFPLFHVSRLSTVASPIDFDTLAAANRFWIEDLPAAHADNATVIALAYQTDPSGAIKEHARFVGLGGAAYFFIKGEGKVVSYTHDAIRLVLAGDPAPQIEIQIGPIFGNAVRDATGLLDVNRFPSLEDFNEIASDLNQRVESRVLPPLRARVTVGAHVIFTGCAEAGESAQGQQVLSVIPIKAEVR